jgi:hypothetical protein
MNRNGSAELLKLSVKPYLELMRLEKVRFFGLYYSPVLTLIPSRLEQFSCFVRLVCFWDIFNSMSNVILFLAWGLTMAAFTTNLPLRSYIAHLLKWLVGAFILRSSACTVNDIFDRHVDAHVGPFTAC